MVRESRREFTQRLLQFICCLCIVKNQGHNETGKVSLQLLLWSELAKHNKLCFPLHTLVRNYADQVVKVTRLVCREAVAQHLPLIRDACSWCFFCGTWLIPIFTHKQVTLAGTASDIRMCNVSGFSVGAGMSWEQSWCTLVYFLI